MLRLMPKQMGHLRAPRVFVPPAEKVIVSVDSNKVVATVCKLSRTGGSVRLSKSFASGTLGEITMNTAFGKVSATIEFLRTTVDGVPEAQAFRFIHIEPTDRRRLEDALVQMLEHGLGDGQGGAFRRITRVAHSVFGLRRTTD